MTNQRNSEVTPLLITNASTVSSVGEANTDSTQDALRKARRLLYVSHSASQFSEQSWQFGLILFLAAFTNYTSLILVSSYGLATGLTVCLAGPSAGRYFVDSLSWNRLSAAQFLISAQTLSVLTATAFCYALLIFHKQQQDGTHASQFSAEDAATANWFHRWLKGVPLDGYSIILLIGIHFFGPLAQILDKSFLISIERDWVVVMGQVAADGTMINDTTGLSNPQPSKTWLSETNVFMKQIDLSCRVAAPAVSGFVIGAATSNGGKNDLANAALFVGILNAAALVVEYFCTAHIYKLIPTLGVKHAAPPAKGNSTSSKKASDEENGDKTTTDVQSSSTKDGVDSGCGCGFVKLPNGLRIYMEQPISWAGLGLAMLYLNSLTFGGLMTAYLVWRGMRLETVGGWRGINSVAGLAGTFVYSYSVKRLTMVSTGMWSIIFQFVCISVSFGSFFVASYELAMIMLISGVIASRAGLWVFDIAATQLMQEFIPEGIRGVVGGTQQSLNAVFQLSSFALGLVFPDPHDFPIYASAGYALVGVAAFCYAFGIYVRKDEFLTESERRQMVSG